MGTKRKTTTLRNGDIVDVEEFHDGNYGAPGKTRIKRRKPTKEEMQKVNAMNRARRCRLRLLTYFTEKDVFATLTYDPKKRPEDMKAALADFQKVRRYLSKEYKKRGKPLFWIRNIERGTKGAWHIHLVLNEIGDTAVILKEAWKKGGIYISEIGMNDKVYDEDFTKLANYITKDKHTTYQKADGTQGKPRIKESSYNSSRNMPLPEPQVDRLVRWKREVKPKKGYYILSIHEGLNPVTGYAYRRYTMARLKPERKSRPSKGNTKLGGFLGGAENASD